MRAEGKVVSIAQLRRWWCGSWWCDSRRVDRLHRLPRLLASVAGRMAVHRVLRRLRGRLARVVVAHIRRGEQRRRQAVPEPAGQTL